MRVSYKLTESDVLEARGKHGGLRIKILPVIGSLLLAVSLFSLIRDPKQYPSFVGPIAMGLLLIFLLRLQVRLSIMRDNRLLAPSEAAISDSGIDVSNPNAASQYGWTAFVRYAETRNLFLVYQASQVFNIFPKRAFTAEEVDAFRNILSQRMGAASVAYQKSIPRVWIFWIMVAIALTLLIEVIHKVMR